MRQLTISAAALIVAAALLSAPANAEYNYGPVQNANQCWKAATGGGTAKDFGYWAACSQPASAPVEHRARKQRHH